MVMLDNTCGYTDLLLSFVNKVLLEQSYSFVLTMVYGCFGAI